MLRLLVLAAILVASVPTADAQLGRLLNRARAAVSGDPAASADANAPSPSTVDGRPAPVLDYTRFLSMTYWPLRGMFYLGHGKDHLIFPPEGLDHYSNDHGEYVIRDADGREVASQRLGSLGTTGSAAFITLGSYAGPSGAETLEPGDYTLDLVFHGSVASRIPFSITAHDSGDPFDPKTVYRRHGPWSQLAYFEHESDRADYQLIFNAWVSAEDLGDDDGRVRLTLYRDGQPVAAVKRNMEPHISTGGDWGSLSRYLVTYDTRENTNPDFFTIEDMTPGAYVMRVSHFDTDETIREYAFEGGAGTIVPHARSATDYEPRHQYLNPRRMEGQTLQKNVNVYWVEATE